MLDGEVPVLDVLDVRLLGPVSVRGQAARPQQLGVLAALAADAGRLVPTGTLIDRVWGDEPPPGARRTLYTHITRLRRMIEPARLRLRTGGYLLDVDPGRVDLHRFRSLSGRSREPGADRASLLRAALDEWRGDPLTGMPGEWAARMRESWRQEWIDAVVAWADAATSAGEPGAVIGPLTAHVAEHPLVEPLAAALMRALHRAGRQAEALEQYARAQKRLAEQLGVDPGPELEALHLTILRGGGEVAVPAVRPAQLPREVLGFTGRERELARLDALLAPPERRPGTVVVAAVTGPAGIGKTALALRWAHSVARSFPDGQLYVNLRGFDPAGTPMGPADALRWFLDALGIAPERVPAGLGEQAGLYRSVLSGRRLLVVLDNALDAEQVRPLLPGAAGGVAVVTSRNQLSGLVASDGAFALGLDLPSHAEAVRLLERRIGPRRLQAEPAAVAEIVERCARLPLALAVVAARAAARPRLPLRHLAEQLRSSRSEPGSSLDLLAGDDPATDARGVFSWSYRRLSIQAARLFRLLSLHPGPDVAVPAAASLAAATVPEARRLLDELTRAHLVTEQEAGRYSFHHLLRAYAAELADALDGPPERDRARRRMLDHYLSSSAEALRALGPGHHPIELPDPGPEVVPERPADREQALRWYAAEHRVLFAAVERAGETGFPLHATQLALAIEEYLDQRGFWHDQLAVQRAALGSALGLTYSRYAGYAHKALARGHLRLRQQPEH